MSDVIETTVCSCVSGFSAVFVAVGSVSGAPCWSRGAMIIKADIDAEYGSIMEAMDTLRAAGIEDMGLITDPKRAPAAAGGGR